MEYKKYTRRQEVEKAINTLKGIIIGIGIDQDISSNEIDGLHTWGSIYNPVKTKHPFNELLPVVSAALEDGRLDQEEKDDILWLCEKLVTETDFFDRATSSIQELHGILAGILLDGKVTREEVDGLMGWINDNDHLRSLWPYDEIEALLIGVSQDGEVSDKELEELKLFFHAFLDIDTQEVLSIEPSVEPLKAVGVCSISPEINFRDKVFCFTGTHKDRTRNELKELTSALGANSKDRITKAIDYLVVGGEGNPCWAYACYGRKIEQAISLRKKGHPILIVHEYDFNDALEDE